MLLSHDYSGIVSRSRQWFSGGLDRSKQSMVKASLEQLVVRAANAIQSLEETSSTFAEAVFIVENLEQLEGAHQELTKLSQYKSWSFESDILKLKKEIDTKLNLALSRVELAEREFDLDLLATWEGKHASIMETIVSYLAPETKARLERSSTVLQSALHNVQTDQYSFHSHRPSSQNALYRALESLRSSEKYEDHHLSMRIGITEKLNRDFASIEEALKCCQCYEEAISWMENVACHLSNGWKHHVEEHKLCFDCSAEIQRLKESKLQLDKSMDFDDADVKIERISYVLDKLSPGNPLACGPSIFQDQSSSSYRTHCKTMNQKVGKYFSMALSALKHRDLKLVQQCILLLDEIERHLGKHLGIVSQKRRDIRDKISTEYLDFCSKAQDAILDGGIVAFESLFSDFRDYVIELPCTVTSSEGKKRASSVHQLIFENLENEISELEVLRDSCEIKQMKEKLVRVRLGGGFVADHFSLLYQEILTSEHLSVDSWLQKIWGLCLSRFGAGRDLQHIKQFATVRMCPSASDVEIMNAYNEFRKNQTMKMPEHNRVNNAFQVLCNRSQTNEGLPFDDVITGLGEQLQEKCRRYLSEQKYSSVADLLFGLNQLRCLEDVASSKFDPEHARRYVEVMVKNFVKKVQVEVDTNWTEHKYRELNDSINDLKQMEDHLKQYPDIFPSSWNHGILQTIETEIESLGTQAKKYVVSKETARLKFDDFKRCFLRMGSVLTELPFFRAWTKSIMSSVLESCLSSECGFSFVFELGLALQKGDELASNEENRVGQLLLTEFSHFKEVQRMVWNDETNECKRPVEETLREIRGLRRDRTTACALHVESSMLYDYFLSFETRYRELLSDLLAPDADIAKVVRYVRRLSDSLKPVDCIGGWTKSSKDAIPPIVAGVLPFSLY